MKDNFEGLTEIFNAELKNIKVSEELKLKTLEKCQGSKKISMNKGFVPITCTIAACLLMGVIIYPIYNSNNLMNKEQIAINTSEKGITEIDKPHMYEAMPKKETDVTEDPNNKIINNEKVEKDQKEVNKLSEEQKQEKEKVALNEQSLASLKIQSSEESKNKDKAILSEDKDIVVATNGDISDKEKSIKGVENSITFSKEKGDTIHQNDETKVKVLSLQEAREIFQDNIKLPSYIPKDFYMESILAPEIDNNSSETYEIIYKNNSQYFKITGYKNTNTSNIATLVPNSGLESKDVEENNAVININKIPVRYTISEGIDDKELPYVKLTWENCGKEYSAEGNVPWAELINIVSSIIK